MNNINILIIEDTLAESEALVKTLEANNYTVVGIASTYSDALTMFYKYQVDLVIIDVFLNGQPEGITFAETISIVPNASKPFVFLTSSKDRQIFERAKLTHPFSFLLKPFNELEILYAVEMAVEKFYEQPNSSSNEEENTIISNDYFFIKKKDSLKKVLIADILYIEVENRYCNVVLENEKFLVFISLKKISILLEKNKFIRTHRNYIVNADKIEEIMMHDNLIILKGNHKITMSEKYKDIIKKFNTLT